MYGPESVRHNDSFTLDDSNIEQRFEALQAGDPFFFKIHGDSAYVNGVVLATGGGRGMASVRESIEWTYKDLKTLWKYMDYRHVLQLRKQPIAKIFFVCMLLRNALVTMHGSQSVEYFVCLPPSFEEWCSQGPSAHPLPSNNIWSPQYVPPVEMED